MNRRPLLASLVAIVASFVGISRASAQAEGTVAGIVRQKESRAGLPAAEVLVDDRIGAVTDTGGRYRVRARAQRLAPGRSPAHRLSRGGARQRVRARRRDRGGGLRSRVQSDSSSSRWW